MSSRTHLRAVSREVALLGLGSRCQRSACLKAPFDCLLLQAHRQLSSYFFDRQRQTAAGLAPLSHPHHDEDGRGQRASWGRNTRQRHQRQHSGHRTRSERTTALCSRRRAKARSKLFRVKLRPPKMSFPSFPNLRQEVSLMLGVGDLKCPYRQFDGLHLVRSVHKTQKCLSTAPETINPPARGGRLISQITVDLRTHFSTPKQCRSPTTKSYRGSMPVSAAMRSNYGGALSKTSFV
jgi:hypothetical protein